MAVSINGTTPPQYQVFINFRGEELRKGFVGFLLKELRAGKVNAFIDESELKGTDLQNLFRRIEGSRVVVAILSERYTESSWCLDELVKMMEQMEQGKLVVIPVFFRLDPCKCNLLLGAFGDNFRILEQKFLSEPERIQKWKNALASVFQKSGMTLDSGSDESKFVELIVENVKKVLLQISTEERENSKHMTAGEHIERFAEGTFTEEIEEPADAVPRFGIEQRLMQLEEKLQFHNEETCIVGVVGMPGIGKTTIAKMLYERWQQKFESRMFFQHVSKKSKEYGFDWLQKRLIQELLKDFHPKIGYSEKAHEIWKEDLLKRKVLVVLDDVTGKKQIKLLLGKRDWIKKGSKIVITSSDESLLQKLVNHTYVVPRLNGRDSLLYFTSHALSSDYYEKGNFLKLSRNILNYVKGNPLALRAFGLELHGKDEVYWKQRIETMTEDPNEMVDHVIKRRYDELRQRQKDVLLDVACFFRSENESYVRCLVRGEIGHLIDKFLVNISNTRVEMHNLICTFAKGLASKALAENNTGVQWRLWNHVDIMCVLNNQLQMENVRGVFLDTSKVLEQMSFDANIFSSMCNLLYLKIYSSAFPEESKTDIKISIPKEFQLPLDEVRYLHWLKFPLEKLPSDFTARKLVSLELPHSQIKQVWEGVKDTPKLKWVDLSNSHKLSNLSGLSNAQNLERLNLEGCTSLVNLPEEMGNMQSLVFLNMRSCKRLRFLPKMNLSSLKNLILTDCSKLQEFEVISENLEALYLDGTALKELPPASGDLERLAILNLKGCEMLECLPESFGKLKALEELILSGCSKLESVPKDMRNLRILLLDGTRIKEMPEIYSLQRLCLSRNNAMTRLQGNICQLNHLKWIELKKCMNITYLPTLPPNLELFNAHGCERLEAVGNPLALLTMTETIHSTFIFTNCNNLGQDEREVISSYAYWKCHRLALECNDRAIVSGASFNICFPGFDVPSWFQHQAVGSVLEPSLQPHCWNWNNKLFGIALCAVVSFHDHNKDPLHSFSVKCTLKFENEDGSPPICFHYDVGCLSESDRIETDHVFIGYASCSDITKRLEDHFSGKSIPTEASLEFHVSGQDISEVVNCGFSLVYAEPQNIPVEANHYRTIAKKDDKWDDKWIEDVGGYIFMALGYMVLLSPQHYFKYYNYCWPLLPCYILLVSAALLKNWVDRKKKQ